MVYYPELVLSEGRDKYGLTPLSQSATTHTRQSQEEGKEATGSELPIESPAKRLKLSATKETALQPEMSICKLQIAHHKEEAKLLQGKDLLLTQDLMEYLCSCKYCQSALERTEFKHKFELNLKIHEEELKEDEYTKLVRKFITA